MKARIYYGGNDDDYFTCRNLPCLPSLGSQIGYWDYEKKWKLGVVETIVLNMDESNQFEFVEIYLE